MSTNAVVAIKEGYFYTFIRNHYDSYIDNLGINLYKNYDDIKKVNELIFLGNTESIGHDIELEHGTKAYNRDEAIPWSECGFDAVCKVEDLFLEDYVYIFDSETNKWSFWYRKDKKIRDLDEVLHSKRLLKEIFLDSYTTDYFPTFLNDCLNA